MKNVTIISGGQTGADRGALEAAKALGVPTGGFCPFGYRTEKGPDLSLRDFGLVPTESRGYRDRTAQNVYRADAVIIFMEKKSAGSTMTVDLGTQHRKRLLVLDSCGPYTPQHLADSIRRFLAAPPTIRHLMIAGNRESKAPGIARRVYEILMLALT